MGKVISIAILCLILVTNGESGNLRDQHVQEVVKVGQPSEERPATAEVKEMVASIKGQIETSLRGANAVTSGPGTSVRISAKSYRAQLVNGINYFVRVKITVGKSKGFYYHIKMYKSFTGSAQFVGITGPKGRSDAVMFF